MSLKGKREYQVTVETVYGPHTVTVWPNQHVQAVLAEVLARDEITRNIEQYELVHGGRPLDRLDLVRSAGIEDGDTLVVESNPVSI